VTAETEKTSGLNLGGELLFWVRAIWLFWLCESLALYFQVTFYEGEWSLVEGWGIIAADFKQFTPMDVIMGLAIDMAAGAVLFVTSVFFLRLVRKIRQPSDISPFAFHGAAFLSFISFLYGGAIINLVLFPTRMRFREVAYTGLWGLASVFIGILIYRHLRRNEVSGAGTVTFWSLTVAIMFCLFGIWPWMDYQTTLAWTVPAGFVAKFVFLAAVLISEQVLLYLLLKLRFIKPAISKPPKRRVWLKNIAAITPILLAVIAAVVEAMPGKGVDSADVGVTEKNPPNVLLIVMDTVRADALSCYPNSKGNTPFLDSFAARGVLFEDARSPTPWTLPGHASMFTSLYPTAHGASWEYTYLKDDFVTIAEIFKAAGYRTAAFSSNVWVSPFTNVTQGFEYYYLTGAQNNFDRKAKERPLLLWEAIARPVVGLLQEKRIIEPPDPLKSQRSVKINTMVKKWVYKNHRKDKPTFVFINYVDAHHPYRPTKKFMPEIPKTIDLARVVRFNKNPLKIFIKKEVLTQEELEFLQSLYYRAVSYEDHIIRLLFDILDQSGFLKNAVVIITSDHGEYLGEHGQLCHLFGVHEPVIRVPFILYAPGKVPAGAHFSVMAQTVDVVPTLLELAGVMYKKASRFQGKSLIKSIVKSVPAREYSISELMYPTIPLRMLKKEGGPRETIELWEARQRTITDDAYQLEVYSNDFRRLWRLETAEEQTLDATVAQPARVKLMKNALERWLAGFSHARPSDKQKPVMTREIQERLRAMGYLD